MTFSEGKAMMTFLIGLVVGAVVGTVLFALCAAQDDRRDE